MLARILSKIMQTYTMHDVMELSMVCLTMLSRVLQCCHLLIANSMQELQSIHLPRVEHTLHSVSQYLSTSVEAMWLVKRIRFICQKAKRTRYPFKKHRDVTLIQVTPACTS